MDEDALVEISEDDTAEAVRAKVNAVVRFLKTEVDLETAEGKAKAERAIEDMQSAIRALQESRQAPSQDTSDFAGMIGRYRFADPRNAEGFSIRLKGALVEGEGYQPGFLDDTRDGRPEIQREIQQWVQRRAIIATIVRANAASQGKRLADDQVTPRCDQQIARLFGQLESHGSFGRALLGVPGIRAFVDASGKGGDWIPTDTLPLLDQEIQYARRLAANFEEVAIERDSDILYLDAGFIPYMRSAPVDDDPAKTPKLSSLKTSKSTATLPELAVRTLISRNAVEDALLPVIGLIERAGVEALIAGEEDCLINGHNTSGAHQDTGLATWNPDSYYPAAPGGGSQDHRRAHDGIRRRAFAASNATARAAYSFDELITDRHSLKGPKQGPRDVIAIPSGLALARLAKLDQYQTLDKYGTDAYNLTGEIGRVNGIPVLESQFATDDLNATGIHDGATKTKGGLSMAIRSRLRRIVKKGHGTRVESQVDIATNMMTMVWSRRQTYKWVKEGTEKNAFFGFNV